MSTPTRELLATASELVSSAVLELECSPSAHGYTAFLRDGYARLLWVAYEAHGATEALALEALLDVLVGVLAERLRPLGARAAIEARDRAAAPELPHEAEVWTRVAGCL